MTSTGTAFSFSGQSSKEMAKLYCNYRSTPIPIYWTKVEYSNIDPPVVLFHDVISQSEIDWMIETATEQVNARFNVSLSKFQDFVVTACYE